MSLHHFHLYSPGFALFLVSFASNKTTVTSGTFLFFLCLFPGNMKLKQIRTEPNYPLQLVFIFLMTLPQREEEKAATFAALSFSSSSSS